MSVAGTEPWIIERSTPHVLRRNFGISPSRACESTNRLSGTPIRLNLQKLRNLLYITATRYNALIPGSHHRVSASEISLLQPSWQERLLIKINRLISVLHCWRRRGYTPVGTNPKPAWCERRALHGSVPSLPSDCLSGPSSRRVVADDATALPDCWTLLTSPRGVSR